MTRRIGATGSGGTRGPAAPAVHDIKPQRLRDPVYDIIEFDLSDEFEHALWAVVQTPPFQRLRRIRQLGFSEFVYPGATHSRFGHSIGVFHMARRLMGVVEKQIRTTGGRYRDSAARRALAAALVHDVGHGMFSHGFEEVGKELDLPMARHETVSERLIRDGEIAEALNVLGSGFANDVATLIAEPPTTFHAAVVSSQFDADRLDYMRRDRLMTGVGNGAIDLEWLIANLSVDAVPTGADDESGQGVETFVLGPKAVHAAEDFVLALFQLYPTIYFHKTTRAAEKVFTALILRIFGLVQDGEAPRTGLPETHPLVGFATASDSLEAALALDDTVLWGSLSMLEAAPDEAVRDLASRLRRRRLPKCIDVRAGLMAALGPVRSARPEDRAALSRRIDRLSKIVRLRAEEWSADRSAHAPRILTDEDGRSPYKRHGESKGLLDQIRIRDETGDIRDIRDHSPVIDGIERFKFSRAYVDADDQEAKDAVERFVTEALHNGEDTDG